MKKVIGILLLLFLISPVIAADTVNTSIVSSPYIDINIFFFIVILALLFLFISNVTTPEQNAPLWALIALFFAFPAAYFANMISRTTIAQTTASDGTLSVAIQQTVFHPEWLSYLLGLIFIISLVNVFYIWTKKPIEKPKSEDF